ncbi:hypothetical protein FNV43_RR26098 [Rhamnella rubrinervis]|uniref:Uncharacterized protein n=1 Tax=Rhamnella rubrinervis TaxID=2594499 RepID=A0A8K0GJB5_9ROSA|nr:hypothetical protein FNV43_RR26098 [Rhamnella rubrinervis]
MGNFGDMELLKLSKFKLQLRSLITEVGELRERERSAAEQLHHSFQKQKQTEEEYGRKLQELQEELASSLEMRQKLERQVICLENENALLENKQKELKGTLNNLLQSREYFVNAYEESTSNMKRSIEIKDRKLSFLSEKIKSHLLLFDSIEKEALSVKQVVDNIERLVSEKEEVVAGLKRKMDMITEFEKALHNEVGSIGIILKKIQSSMNEEDKWKFSSLPEQEEGCNRAVTEEHKRIEDVVQNSTQKCSRKAYGTGATEYTDQYGIPTMHSSTVLLACLIFFMKERNLLNQPAFPRDAYSASSKRHSAAKAPSVSVKDDKDKSSTSIHPLASECSTTQAQASQDPDDISLRAAQFSRTVDLIRDFVL